MSEITTFESRKGALSCTPQELYHFLNDIRNFERFVPADRFSDIRMEKESCSFSVPMLGKVSIMIADRKEYSEVVYRGSAMAVDDFALAVSFDDTDTGSSEVRLTVNARINPLLRMAAAEPVKNMLETIVGEMEKFTGWTDIKEGS
ncbi:MAG TPA: hypothetical protein PLV06_11380 [Bacteroidales bacterium]|nr:hypothetical protein [Bacteroidales bacterium]HPF03388.1 hypothetical protein [Bacteroidales bacterium]HPJ59561.1 hypothetical protein [Bacteroidales bacterium]HPR12978.1 hypothetical protein [Bacteroidales bacterium]HRW84698.1 hypothetical protein [Bacteroidales bacterium]